MTVYKYYVFYFYYSFFSLEMETQARDLQVWLLHYGILSFLAAADGYIRQHRPVAPGT
jgi:hypothetical protein